jgi:menaquinone-dependent protoporphyrinogen oxidase
MKVLVTVASKHGATAEIGSVIGSLLETEGLDVDVLPPDEVERLDGYGAVVLGSGVYAGHWLKPAKEFVERHEAALRDLPLFVFSSGPVGEPPKETDEPAEIAAIEASLHPVEHRVFGGRLTGSQLGPFEKLIIKVVKAPFLDDRPWDEIAEWGKEIARYLKAEEAEKKAETERIGAIVAATTSVVL